MKKKMYTDISRFFSVLFPPLSSSNVDWKNKNWRFPCTFYSIIEIWLNLTWNIFEKVYYFLLYFFSASVNCECSAHCTSVSNMLFIIIIIFVSVQLLGVIGKWHHAYSLAFLQLQWKKWAVVWAFYLFCNLCVLFRVLVCFLKKKNRSVLWLAEILFPSRCNRHVSSVCFLSFTCCHASALTGRWRAPKMSRYWYLLDYQQAVWKYTLWTVIVHPLNI